MRVCTSVMGRVKRVRIEEEERGRGGVCGEVVLCFM